MAEKKSEVLEMSKKLSTDEMFNYSEAIKQLVIQKKAEFEAVQGKITQYKTQLITLETRMANLEAETKLRLDGEKQKFENERQTKMNDWANREDALNRGERNLAERLTSVSDREFQAEKLHEERKQILNERLKLENLNNESERLIKDYIVSNAEAKDKIDLAAKKELEAENKLKEAQNILSISEGKNQDLLNRENDLIKQKENLEILRNEVTPKIEEYQELIKKNEAILLEVKNKEQEINDKIEQDNKLLSILDERDRKAKTKELDLATKEKELLRKEIIFKNQ